MSVFPARVASGSLVGPRGRDGTAGAPGIPGTNGVPTAEAVAGYLGDGGNGVDEGNDQSLDRLLDAPASATARGLRTQIADRSALPTYVTTRDRANPFDPIRCVYNWKPSNTRRLRAGLGKAQRGRVSHHIVAGDSMAAGSVYGIAGADPLIFDRAGAWPMIMRDRLAALGIPKGGSGFVRSTDNALGSPYCWTFSSSPAWSHVGKFVSNTTSGGIATFTVPAELAGATAYSHLWFDAGTGGGTYSFNISVNGAGSGAGFRTTTSASGAARYRVTTLLLAAPLAAGDTIQVGAGGPNGHYMIGGRVWTPATGGLAVHNLAQSSSRAYSSAAGQNDRWASTGTGGLGTLLDPATNTAWTSRTVPDAVFVAGDNTVDSATAAFTVDDLGKSITTPAGTTGLRLPGNGNIYITAINSATSVEVSQAPLISATGVSLTIGQTPDVLHISLGANDLGQGVSLANISAGITAARALLPNADVVLYANPQPAAASGIPNAIYDAWVASLYDLADARDCPLVDMRARFGPFTDWAGAGLAGDGLAHANSYLFAEWGMAAAALVAS